MKKRQPSALAAILAILLTASFIVISFVAAPLLALLVGMAIGYILELFTGDYLVRAAHALGLKGVSDGDLPKIFGLLAVIVMLTRASISGLISREDSE